MFCQLDWGASLMPEEDLVGGKLYLSKWPLYMQLDYVYRSEKDAINCLLVWKEIGDYHMHI